MSLVLALGWAVLAVLLWQSPPADKRLFRFEEMLQRPRRRGLPGPDGLWLVGASAAVVLAMGTSLGLRAVILTMIALVIVATLARVGRDWLEARRRWRRRDEVARGCRTVAQQLAVGAVPRTALDVASTECGALRQAVATAAIGGDVAACLIDLGREPGREGIASLGRAWRLGEDSGAPIADLAAGVSNQIKDERTTRQLVAAELAGPRASGRLLAFLPLVGVAMGRAVGGDPVTFLTQTLGGLCCLFAGACLACGGVVWTEHLARTAEED